MFCYFVPPHFLSCYDILCSRLCVVLFCYVVVNDGTVFHVVICCGRLTTLAGDGGFRSGRTSWFSASVFSEVLLSS